MTFEMIRQRTGRGWEEWFDLLDGAGLAERPHRDIARWVAELQGADRQRRVGRESTAVGAGGRVLRCLVLAAVVAGLAAQARVDGLAGGLVLGLVLWIGFPAVPWVGAIVHENIRWRLAAIHAGDWFVKLLAVGAVVSVWP